MKTPAAELEDVEAHCAELTDHGEVGRPEALRVCETLIQDLGSPFSLGAYVRVRGGVRRHTRDFPEATRLLASFLAQEFPGEDFLTLQVERNKPATPHKDLQNSYFPSLLCNLTPGAPGGAWVEDPDGDQLRHCSDGKVRRGRMLRGKRYRLSARVLWHAAEELGPDSNRIVLIGWIPAGWTCISGPDSAYLRCLGFRFPDQDREARCALSEWKDRGLVQQKLVTSTMPPSVVRGIWPSGILVGSSLHHCLSSDEESDAAQIVSHRTIPVTLSADDSTSETSDEVILVRDRAL
eukprot:s29_g9.t1